MFTAFQGRNRFARLFLLVTALWRATARPFFNGDLPDCNDLSPRADELLYSDTSSWFATILCAFGRLNNGFAITKRVKGKIKDIKQTEGVNITFLDHGVESPPYLVPLNIPNPWWQGVFEKALMQHGFLPAGGAGFTLPAPVHDLQEGSMTSTMGMFWGGGVGVEADTSCMDDFNSTECRSWQDTICGEIATSTSHTSPVILESTFVSSNNSVGDKSDYYVLIDHWVAELYRPEQIRFWNPSRSYDAFGWEEPAIKSIRAIYFVNNWPAASEAGSAVIGGGD